jgi:hypothetical protein
MQYPLLCCQKLAAISLTVAITRLRFTASAYLGSLNGTRPRPYVVRVAEPASLIARAQVLLSPRCAARFSTRGHQSRTLGSRRNYH